jgi:hypothetical protein
MDQLQFFRIVYGFGVSPVTVTFVVQCTMEDLDKEVRRVALLKGVNAYGVFLEYSAEKVECPTGEWSSERWEAIRQLELEHNVFLHSLSKEDADEALKETTSSGLSSELWMKLRLRMREDDHGLTGDTDQEYRFIEDVYDAMIRLEEFNRNRGY